MCLRCVQSIADNEIICLDSTIRSHADAEQAEKAPHAHATTRGTRPWSSMVWIGLCPVGQGGRQQALQNQIYGSVERADPLTPPRVSAGRSAVDKADRGICYWQ
jgi:hypothetical protein